MKDAKRKVIWDLRKIWVWKMRVCRKTVVCFGICLVLCLTACGEAGKEGKDDKREEASLNEDFFAYTDEENRLYLWKKGMTEPLFLTDSAFAAWEGAGMLEEEDIRKAEKYAKAEYWEGWEYWQEWDDDMEQWVWNNERAMRGIVKEAEGELFYFPQKMRWESFCMERSTEEWGEAKRYSKEEDVSLVVGVKLFLFDLFYLDTKREEGECVGQVAEDVCLYEIDRMGNIWYCKVEEDGAGKTEGYAENSEMQTGNILHCMLYRYDGEAHLKIGEINVRRNDPFLVSGDGEYVLFYGLDDGLYGCKPGQEAALLVETTGVDMFGEAGIYADLDMGKIIYAKGNTIHKINGGRKEKEWQMVGKGEYLTTGMLGEDGDKIFTLSMEKEGSYADWVVREEEKEDEDTRRLWELMEKSRFHFYASLFHAEVTDISSDKPECVEEMDGYLLSCLDGEGMATRQNVYYIEMIPAEGFEKFTLSELFGGMTPAEILDNYAYQKEYYEGDDESAITETLDSCVDLEALKGRAKIYIVTENGIVLAEKMNSGNIFVEGETGEGGDILYLKLCRYIDLGEDNRFGGTFSHFSYGYLYDVYALDKEGNYEKAAEAVEESIIRGDEIFYSRIAGAEGAVCLYRSGLDKPMAEAVSISMESIQKSYCSEAALFLVNGFMPEEEREGIYVEAEEELLRNYRSKIRDREEDGIEIQERTLVLHDGSGAKELEEEVYRYGFFAGDDVWMLKYEDGEEERAKNRVGNQAEGYGEEEAWEDWDAWSGGDGSGRSGGSKLLIYENGEKKQIAERAVWMVVPEERNREETVIAKNASWRYE